MEAQPPLTASPVRTPLATPFTKKVGIQVPIICGAMYPCSNPELVAAASEAGGIGVVQPVSLTFVHGYDFREGLRFIKTLTSKPIGMNALIEKSSRSYHARMEQWIDIALEEGVRFFVTSLGKPGWVVDRVSPSGGVVYHDVTERKWALKGLDGGVDGFMAVNRRAGGHAGPKSKETLFTELADLGVPLICAGGVGSEDDFVAALRMGYAGVQMGTAFIATSQCTASDTYKEAIVAASENDIVLSERITGIPLAVIDTPYIRKLGLKAGPLARWMLRGRKRKHLMRLIYTLLSVWRLKRSAQGKGRAKEFWQAGRSVSGISRIRPAGQIVREFADAVIESGK